jgi:hypothetical protein
MHTSTHTDFDTLRHNVVPQARRLASQAEAATRQGLDTLRDSSNQLRLRASEAGEAGLRYLRDEPLKPVIIAAVAAGALMALAQWLARRSHY